MGSLIFNQLSILSAFWQSRERKQFAWTFQTFLDQSFVFAAVVDDDYRFYSFFWEERTEKKKTLS